MALQIDLLLGMNTGFPLPFGKYLLLERVNIGGMAEVFKAKTRGIAGFEKIVAIKRMLPVLLEEQAYIYMFENEARIAVQLHHPNIIQGYELGRHGDHYYIAMEYLPSRDLRTILDMMEEGALSLSVAQTAYIIGKVCEGLHYAHNKKDSQGKAMEIIHRDISPQNILVSWDGQVKLIDFGIAKAANRAAQTQAGVLKGKFAYMSPEQINGRPIDHRSDQFAVGILLFELLTGQRLFYAESDMATINSVRDAKVPDPSRINPRISPELAKVVRRALMREPRKRYKNCGEMAEELKRFVLLEEGGIYTSSKLRAFMHDVFANEIGAEQARNEELLNFEIDKSTDVEVDDEGFGEQTFVIESADADALLSSMQGGLDILVSDEQSDAANYGHNDAFNEPSSGFVSEYLSTSTPVKRSRDQSPPRPSSVARDQSATAKPRSAPATLHFPLRALVDAETSIADIWAPRNLLRAFYLLPIIGLLALLAATMIRDASPSRAQLHIQAVGLPPTASVHLDDEKLGVPPIDVEISPGETSVLYVYRGPKPWNLSIPALQAGEVMNVMIDFADSAASDDQATNAASSGARQSEKTAGSSSTKRVERERPRDKIQSAASSKAASSAKSSSPNEQQSSRVSRQENARSRAAQEQRSSRSTKSGSSTATKSSAAAKKVSAKIRFNTRPAAYVLFGGKRYGPTPITASRAISIPVGTHRIQFMTVDKKKRHSATITVSGEGTGEVNYIFPTERFVKVRGPITIKK